MSTTTHCGHGKRYADECIACEELWFWAAVAPNTAAKMRKCAKFLGESDGASLGREAEIFERRIKIEQTRLGLKGDFNVV